MFKVDGPVMRFLDLIANLIILNFLTLICCIPVVTAGAAFSSLHYVMLKVVREEEGYVVKDFFKAFRQNFKQSTIMWILMVIIFGILYIDVRMCAFYNTSFSGFIMILVIGVAIEAALIALYIFPVISRYSDSNAGILRTSLTMAVVGFKKLRTVFAALAEAVPWIVLYFGGFKVIPVIIFFFFSVPAFLRAVLYSGIFSEFEERVQARKEEEKAEALVTEETVREDTSDNGTGSVKKRKNRAGVERSESIGMLLKASAKICADSEGNSEAE